MMMRGVFCFLFVATNGVLASRMLSIPFQILDRKGGGISNWSRQKLGDIVNTPLENIDLAYLINVSIGTPPQPFTLLLDTGSSTTWVSGKGCGHYCGLPIHTYDKTNSSTYQSSDLVFNIRYGEGFAKGVYAKDTLLLNGVSVPDINFAISDFNDGELTTNGADGIIGIGPDNLTVYNNPNGVVVPTIITVMHQQDIIEKNLFSVYFQPIQDFSSYLSRVNGEITFGGVNLERIKGDVYYMPLTTSQDFQDYWAADIDAIYVRDKSVPITPGLSGLLDTGSTLVMLPEKVIQSIFSNIRGIRRDFSGQYIVPCASTELPSISLSMGGSNFTLEPEHYVIRGGLLGHTASHCYTYLQEAPPFVGAILGYGFLQQFVSIYDNENRRVGLAKRA
ncbi:aspartic peptidase domain-containing protein [Spinellus fusiger]|nr:aspartic peptidase domain-containing protein [Spinellus fusiger]